MHGEKLIWRLTINSIWGVVPSPLTEKKSWKKRQMQSKWFLQVFPKSSLTTFEIIFETVSALSAFQVTIIGGVVYKKSMIFKVFGVYLSEFLIFLHEIFFGRKILSISCDKYQNFDFWCSSYSENEAKSPGLTIFDDFGHFSNCLFSH